MAFSDTILLPRYAEVPDYVLFYKRVNYTIYKPIIIKVYSLEPLGLPIFDKIEIQDFQIYDNALVCFPFRGKSVDTYSHLLAEVDIVNEQLRINLDKNIVKYITDDAENRLIQEMRRNPSLAKDIPKELWEHPSFKRKIDVERTKESLKSTNSTGLFVHDKLSDGPLSDINAMLGLKQDRASREKRPKPPLSPPPPRRSATCKGSDCSISGGKRRRTRKNKRL